jgi:hypothetical protein
MMRPDRQLSRAMKQMKRCLVLGNDGAEKAIPRLRRERDTPLRQEHRYATRISHEHPNMSLCARIVRDVILNGMLGEVAGQVARVSGV